MTARFLFARTAAVVAAVILAGCNGGSSAPTGGSASRGQPADDPEVRTALNQLSPEDRTAAGAQKVCPVTGEPLGSMGMPPKLTLKGEPVFLCCESCRKKAEADPDKTLAAVAKAKAGAGKE